MLTRIFLSPDGLTLTPEQVCWATELALQTAGSPEQQWQTYLMGLARLGVEDWFQERAPQIKLSAAIDKAAFGLGRLTAGAFQVQIVTTDSPADPEVLIPAAPEQAKPADFYLLVEILEELAQVRVYGYLQPAQLTSPQAAFDPAESVYIVPHSAFTPNPGQLLLYLQHLKPASTPAPIPSSPHPLTPSSPHPPINAKLWLTNQLDHLAQVLGWVLLPPLLSPTMRSLRSASSQLDRVVSDLIERRVIELPPQLGNAYRDMQFGAVTLRLYAITWELPRADQPPDWMLLLILGTPAGDCLPSGLRLQVRDAAGVLAEPKPEDDQTPYLYTQVSGGQHELFYISLALAANEMLFSIGFSPQA